MLGRRKSRQPSRKCTVCAFPVDKNAQGAHIGKRRTTCDSLECAATAVRGAVAKTICGAGFSRPANTKGDRYAVRHLCGTSGDAADQNGSSPACDVCMCGWEFHAASGLLEQLTGHTYRITGFDRIISDQDAPPPSGAFCFSRSVAISRFCA